MALRRNQKRNQKKSKRQPARGGRRAGAGRRSERGPGGINWARVRRFARLGAERDTIVVALGVGAEQLRDVEVLNRLQQEMARGAALYKLDLLEDVARLRRGGEGSVNATIASLRQAHGWDRPDSAKGRERARPDSEAAVAELERTLKRFRAPR